MKLKAVVILLIIIVSLFPVYIATKYLQRKINPKGSFGRLILYIFLVFAMIFIYTFLLVFVIKRLFHGA